MIHFFAANLKKVITSDEVHAYFKRESDPKWRVDETKRPDEAPPTAHFRKLTVDWITELMSYLHPIRWGLNLLHNKLQVGIWLFAIPYK